MIKVEERGSVLRLHPPSPEAPCMAADGRMDPQWEPGHDEQSRWLFQPWPPRRVTQELFHQASARKPDSPRIGPWHWDNLNAPRASNGWPWQRTTGRAERTYICHHPPPSPLPYQHSIKLGVRRFETWLQEPTISGCFCLFVCFNKISHPQCGTRGRLTSKPGFTCTCSWG